MIPVVLEVSVLVFFSFWIVSLGLGTMLCMHRPLCGRQTSASHRRTGKTCVNGIIFSFYCKKVVGWKGGRGGGGGLGREGG